MPNHPLHPFRHLLSRMILIGLVLLGLFIPIHLSSTPRETPLLFPPDAGIVNVKAAPYYAQGDGKTDDTAALQAAIAQNRNRLIYFPPGTYLISDTLYCRSTDGQQKRFFLQGASQSKTILQLKTQSPNFQDPNQPQPLLTFWDGPVNDATAFRNTLQNLTLDVGAKNPGAIALRFRANNFGSVENVTLTTSDPQYQGKYGLDLSLALNGPLLVQNLTVNGFDIGIYFTGALHSATLNQITLNHQREYGIYNRRQVLNLHHLTSHNRVPVLYNDSESPNVGGLVTLINGSFHNGSPTQTALLNQDGAGLYLRNLTSDGYQFLLESHRDGQISRLNTALDEFTSHPILSLFPSPQTALQLPIQSPPPRPHLPLNQWVKVENQAEDDTPALQAALNTGKPVVYFPTAQYQISQPLTIPSHVQQIIGLGNTNLIAQGSLRNSTQALFKITGSQTQPLWIEGLDVNAGNAFFLEHNSPRPLILRNSGSSGYRNLYPHNQLFLENVVGVRFYFQDQQVWGRQVNVESGRDSQRINIDNNHSDVWILGLKTERDVPIITTHHQGKTEVLGGFLYGNRDIPPNTVAFLNQNSSQSLTFVGYNQSFTPYIREYRQSESRDLPSQSLYPIKYGRMIPLFVGYPSSPQK